ncbi:hypothetical protein PK69_00720 [Xanthomonas phaseoli pv. phaseoli]|uniref:Uncharacterized protein n=1 Tax=Xanthomonas campestris pv. phaseoli TaxID=317013 RepID=A0AB34SRF6_XANCH|nr:hypothetical protein AC609_20140 [Xanthomonas phaseoli pv. phaseoli]AZU32036.1 hypothetical protein AC801_19790 [Xanthomonas sp. ISO98C4]AZU27707.1 hypothetical protein AC611_20160 [Xanthomonas phaseoli pv. phaseoli]AZU36472.1 hypothetical protein AC610_20130 [Xanthomonas phaseoli pv. phaseoli]KGT50531.1 hypothetical protein NZ02_13775 [Xanthomonas phaseoli pv. phaseoli]
MYLCDEGMPSHAFGIAVDRPTTDGQGKQTRIDAIAKQARMRACVQRRSTLAYTMPHTCARDAWLQCGDQPLA